MSKSMCASGHDYEKFDDYRIFCKRCGEFNQAPAYVPSWTYYPVPYWTTPYWPNRPYWWWSTSGVSGSINWDNTTIYNISNDSGTYTLLESTTTG